jgi:hypothetical protein
VSFSKCLTPRLVSPVSPKFSHVRELKRLMIADPLSPILLPSVVRVVCTELETGEGWDVEEVYLVVCEAAVGKDHSF